MIRLSPDPYASRLGRLRQTTCPTEDIEWEVQEAEEVYEKIVESLTAIDHVKQNLQFAEQASAQMMSRLYHVMN